MRGRLGGPPQSNRRLKLLVGGRTALVQTPPPPLISQGRTTPGQVRPRVPPRSSFLWLGPVSHRGPRSPWRPGIRSCAKTPGTAQGREHGQPAAGAGPGGRAACDPWEGTGTHRDRGRQLRVVEARAGSHRGAQPRRSRGPGLSPLPASRGLLCAPLSWGRVPGRRLCARSGSHIQATPASRSVAAPSTTAIAQPRLRPRQGRSQSRRPPPPSPPPAPAADTSSPPGGLLCADSGGPASRPLGGSSLRRRGRCPLGGLLCAGSGSSVVPVPARSGPPLRRLEQLLRARPPPARGLLCAGSGSSAEPVPACSGVSSAQARTAPRCPPPTLGGLLCADSAGPPVRRVSREWTPAGAVGRGWCTCGLSRVRDPRAAWPRPVRAGGRPPRTVLRFCSQFHLLLPPPPQASVGGSRSPSLRDARPLGAV